MPPLRKVVLALVSLATIIFCIGAVTTIDLTFQVINKLPVTNGGTGAGTLAAHGLIVGNGTGVVNVTSPGTSGQCFISNGASSDPTPQTCPSGSGIIGSTVSAVTVTSSTAAFAPFSGGGLSSTTETNVDQNAPDSATISNLYVQVSLAPGTGNTFVFTLRDAASSKAVTCTISNTATSCNDLTHSFTPAAGDLLDWQISATGTIIVTPNVLISAQWGGSIATGVVGNCTTVNALAIYPSSGTTTGCGNADFTYATHTLTSAAAGLVDFSAISSSSGFKHPVIAGATAAADGVCDYDSTGKMTHCRTQGLDATVSGTIAILDRVGASTSNTATALTNLAGGAFTVPIAGRYVINQYVFQKTTCSSVGPGTLTNSVAWTDPATGRNTVSFGGTITPATSLGVTQFNTNALAVWLSAGTSVTNTNTYTACTTGTWTFDSHVWLVAQ